MLRFGKSGGMLLAGLAAYAAYKFTKMSPQQKKDLVDNLKEKGRKIFGQFIPENNTSAAPAQRFGEGGEYTV